MGLIKDIKDIQPNNPFNITKADLIGDLEGFPLGVVVRMLEETEKQGNKADIKVFQDHKNAMCGGFNWSATIDGRRFWESIICGSYYNAFYDKYPEYKQYDD